MKAWSISCFFLPWFLRLTGVGHVARGCGLGGIGRRRHRLLWWLLLLKLRKNCCILRVLECLYWWRYMIGHGVGHPRVCMRWGELLSVRGVVDPDCIVHHAHQHHRFHHPCLMHCHFDHFLSPYTQHVKRSTIHKLKKRNCVRFTYQFISLNGNRATNAVGHFAFTNVPYRSVHDGSNCPWPFVYKLCPTVYTGSSNKSAVLLFSNGLFSLAFFFSFVRLFVVVFTFKDFIHTELLNLLNFSPLLIIHYHSTLHIYKHWWKNNGAQKKEDFFSLPLTVLVLVWSKQIQNTTCKFSMLYALRVSGHVHIANFFSTLEWLV